jgi:hypothetical protein
MRSTRPKRSPNFISPGNFGDDVAEWFADELERRGAVIDRDGDFPGQEDFGWYLDLSLKDKPYTIVIGRRPGEADDFEWGAWIERQCGFFRSITGGRNKGMGGLRRPIGCSTVINEFGMLL